LQYVGGSSPDEMVATHVNGELLLYPRQGSNDANQMWMFTPVFNVDGGYYFGYKIALHDTPTSCIEYNSPGKPLKVSTFDQNSPESYIWVFAPSTKQPSAFMLQPWLAIGSVCMDDQHGSIDPGNVIQAYGRNDTSAQHWGLAI
jgi:hypothetical protein